MFPAIGNTPANSVLYQLPLSLSLSLSDLRTFKLVMFPKDTRNYLMLSSMEENLANTDLASNAKWLLLHSVY